MQLTSDDAVGTIQYSVSESTGKFFSCIYDFHEMKKEKKKFKKHEITSDIILFLWRHNQNNWRPRSKSVRKNKSSLWMRSLNTMNNLNGSLIMMNRKGIIKFYTAKQNNLCMCAQRLRPYLFEGNVHDVLVFDWFKLLKTTILEFEPYKLYVPLPSFTSKTIKKQLSTN